MTGLPKFAAQRSNIGINQKGATLRGKLFRSLLTAGVAAAISLMSAIPASAAPTFESAILQSNVPKTAIFDTVTGKFTSVRLGIDEAAHANITNAAICQFSDVCYLSGQVPWANQGFFGTNGTINGNWPHRSGFSSGGYYTSFCYTGPASYCSVTVGPQTNIGFTQQVTGTQVTISGHI